ncbi:hypothetical protein [Subtercola lobariae]|uniref:Uncharacterized protein n=1 Tax=Subtercola lobariae TaxID=1588641 RepID=A0A917BFQ3_9MICO|nr:hypothetical protein [Subtercola lobariae]GGF38666.1 hypothetical protein GCM10011399_34440 [Subtercola lobariae]
MKRGGCLLMILGLVAAIATIVVLTLNGVLVMDYSGVRFDGCGQQTTSYLVDGTKQIEVQSCTAPDFPTSIPLLQGRIVDSMKEIGDNGYQRFDVIMTTSDLDGAQGSISTQLTAAGYHSVDNNDTSTPHVVFENDTYKIYLTFTEGGPHGDTVEYYIVPAGAQ